ncbi:chemotaxis protein CheW [Aquibacillus sediminis]|uniref:chemotaxis protein CheW n=1 Tax=Aquibacillus sediminis TaxID=2574734 RepID=UPI0011092CFE|nr:chemotaxis protein CheW [Aquibacillus sediminis]
MDTTLKVILFQLKQQQYGVNIQQVLSIEKTQAITEVPQTFDFIKGIINLRGEITPVLDLKERLDLGKTEYTDKTRILVVQVHSYQIGLIVDSATDVIDINQDEMDSAPDMIAGVSQDYIQGVAKLKDQLLLLLDLEHVLDFEQLNEVKAAVER